MTLDQTALDAAIGAVLDCFLGGSSDLDEMAEAIARDHATAAITAYLAVLPPTAETAWVLDCENLDLAAQITALAEKVELEAQSERMEYSDGDAEHWRGVCNAAIARAEKTEAALKERDAHDNRAMNIIHRAAAHLEKTGTTAESRAAALAGKLREILGYANELSWTPKTRAISEKLVAIVRLKEPTNDD